MNTVDAVVSRLNTEIDPVTARHKATWEDGNYGHFAKYMENGAIEVLDAWNIPVGQKLLDVGCGAGQTAIPAAKQGLRVTGIDIAVNLIVQARQRAGEARVSARFDVGDAQDLPCDDREFDAVISMFGAMFAPRPVKVSSEFARVLKPGGKLYMANWTKNSMPAQMFKLVSAVVPPAPGTIQPVLWGDEATVVKRLCDEFTDIQLSRKIYPQWQYPFGTTDLVKLFRANFGPVKKAFDAIDPAAGARLFDQLEQVYRNNSEQRNGVLTITGGEYLEVIATRR